MAELGKLLLEDAAIAGARSAVPGAWERSRLFDIVTIALAEAMTSSSIARCCEVGRARTVCRTTMLGTRNALSSETRSCPSGPP
jgi:hypothetical protein